MDLKVYAAKQDRELTADCGDGDSFTFTYNNTKFTKRFISDLLTKFGKDGLDDALVTVDSASALVVQLVTDWDLKSGTRKVPITDEALEDIPFGIIQAVAVAITEDQNPGKD